MALNFAKTATSIEMSATIGFGMQVVSSSAVILASCSTAQRTTMYSSLNGQTFFGSGRQNGFTSCLVSARKTMMVASAFQQQKLVFLVVASKHQVEMAAEHQSNNSLVFVLKNIRPQFGMVGFAFSETQTVARNRTIVLNLRTKSHCFFDDSTEDAIAETGGIVFGSFKNKNVSDVILFGRSSDETNLAVLNDEETKRNYTIAYESALQANLKNKKVGLSKGLVGTNWRFVFSKTGSVVSEIRSVDLFVSELSRHV